MDMLTRRDFLMLPGRFVQMLTANELLTRGSRDSQLLTDGDFAVAAKDHIIYQDSKSKMTNYTLPETITKKDFNSLCQITGASKDDLSGGSLDYLAQFDTTLKHGQLTQESAVLNLRNGKSFFISANQSEKPKSVLFSVPDDQIAYLKFPIKNGIFKIDSAPVNNPDHVRSDYLIIGDDNLLKKRIDTQDYITDPDTFRPKSSHSISLNGSIESRYFVTADRQLAEFRMSGNDGILSLLSRKSDKTYRLENIDRRILNNGKPYVFVLNNTVGFFKKTLTNTTKVVFSCIGNRKKFNTFEMEADLQSLITVLESSPDLITDKNKIILRNVLTSENLNNLTWITVIDDKSPSPFENMDTVKVINGFRRHKKEFIPPPPPKTI